MIRGVSAKLGELEVELQRSQRSIEIPAVKLDITREVAAACQRARQLNRAPLVEDLGADAADSALLNNVQKQLNEWKKAILSVTRLDRDVSSGDALSEISFWLSMDAALNRIQAQLKSPEIGTSLDFLHTAGIRVTRGSSSHSLKILAHATRAHF